jgi:hypothetical protein
MEDDYHHWYDEFHLEEVLQVPDFVAAERCALMAGDPSPLFGDGSHLALFTIESDDIQATMQSFQAAQKTMRVPPCLDSDSVALYWWRSLVERAATSPPAAAGGA